MREKRRKVRVLAKAGDGPHATQYTSACGGGAFAALNYFTSAWRCSIFSFPGPRILLRKGRGPGFRREAGSDGFTAEGQAEEVFPPLAPEPGAAQLRIGGRIAFAARDQNVIHARLVAADQVFLDADVPGQHMGDEPIGQAPLALYKAAQSTDIDPTRMIVMGIGQLLPLRFKGGNF